MLTYNKRKRCNFAFTNTSMNDSDYTFTCVSNWTSSIRSQITYIPHFVSGLQILHLMFNIYAYVSTTRYKLWSFYPSAIQ